jgi:flagellar hook-length control protein FliK
MPMLQFAMMMPVQGNGAALKTESGGAPQTPQADLTADSEALDFAQALLELAQANPNGAALLLALQHSGVSSELPLSLPPSGSLLPSASGSGGKLLPQAQLPAGQFKGQQALSPDEPMPAIDLRELQQSLFGEKTAAQQSHIAAVLADSRQAAAGSHPLEGRSLADFTVALQGLGFQVTGDQPAGATRPVIALPVQVPVAQPGWDNALGERIQWMLSRNVQQAEIKLTPPQLGPLEIKISLHNDQTSVQFLAAHQATRDALEAAIPRLRELFGEINLNLANVDVGQRQAEGAPAQGGGAGQASARQSGLPEEGPSMIQDSDTPMLRLHSRGLLDIYA